MDLSKEIYNSRLLLLKKYIYINKLYNFNKKNKNRTFNIRTKHVQKIMICKNHNKKLPNDGENNVSS